MADEADKPKLTQSPWPPWSAASKPAPIVDEATDLKALRTAVVDAAGVGAGLWFSYLFVLLYLLIAVGGITHHDLFLENPVKLPFVNVDLPPVGFFVLGPLLFLFAHAYVLLHFVLLSSKVGTFHTQLEAQIRQVDVRQQLRRQLPSNIFVQMLAGPREVRRGVFGAMLRLIAQISLIVGPIALLVFFQIQFLPYHPHWGIELWQRMTVVIDIALLWILWPSISRGRMASISWADLRRAIGVPVGLIRWFWALLQWTGPPDNRRWMAWKRVGPGALIAAAAMASMIPILLVFTVSTYPGEWLNEKLQLPIIGSLHRFLFAGEADEVTGRPRSWFSNVLVLTGQSFVDLDKLDKQQVSHSFRGRDLSHVVLSEADVRKSDFSGANMNEAVLVFAKLQNAHFGCARTGRGEALGCTQLKDANLLFAQLQGAQLTSSQLEGAELLAAQLQGADLVGTQFQGSDLRDAQLQGANLERAGLEGANLREAGLEGATLAEAQLQGANLERAQLQGTWFSNEVETEEGTKDIVVAQMEAASLKGVSMWRASGVSVPNTDLTDLENCDLDKKPWTDQGGGPHSFTEWRDSILEQMDRGNMEGRLSALNPSPDNKPQNVIDRQICGSVPSKDQEWDRKVAESLGNLACSSSSAPYVARGLLTNGRIESTGTQITTVAERLLKGRSDPTSCPGVTGFTDRDWAILDELVRKASEQQSKRQSKPTSKPRSAGE
jgi:uncharacterized protein YjbI with pentapeptide repeats